MRETLLIISAGIEAIPGIRKGRELGYHVVVSDGDRNAPGMALADDFLLASTYDVAATVAAAKAYHSTKRAINGVICIASDVPHTVAAVAEALGLVGISAESARLAIDKFAMKEAFTQADLSIPWYQMVDSAHHLQEIVLSRGLPLVLKPVDSRGARGVLLLREGIDLSWAYQNAKNFSPTDRVMVEEYLSGPQVSTESLVIDGTIHTPGFSDRNYEFLDRYAPNIIENGGEMPSMLDEGTQERVKELVQQGTAALGIKCGVVKGDIVVHNGIPHIIELAARLSGGYFCSHSIPSNTGVDILGAAIRQCMGHVVLAEELVPKFQRGVCQRYLFPEPGVIRAIKGGSQAQSVPGIEYCEIRVAVGDRICPIDSHPARAGVLMAVSQSRDVAVSLAEEAISKIHIKID